jgi:hypothetical protein
MTMMITTTLRNNNKNGVMKKKMIITATAVLTAIAIFVDLTEPTGLDYCYSNKGLNRQLITICIKCFDKYNHIDHMQRLQRLLQEEQQQFVAENNNNACLNNNNRNGKLHVTTGGVIVNCNR